ncbi:MAG: precorrin-8X methylmutase [Rhodospirillales bacterium]|jgi:precorrin-8X/cobalt-precorrin-8 methylmutase
MDYLRDGADIYRQSFKAIRAETDVSGLPPDIQPIVLRIVHATASPEIAKDFAYSQDAAQSGLAALAKRAPIFADCAMVMAGIIKSRLAGNEVLCTLYDKGVRELASDMKTTRSAAAVDLWKPRLDGAVCVIGNAPTALFRLLELIEDGARPALVLGFPVGFIGAAESKDALITHKQGVPYVTLRGRRGGSPMAAAALNALTGPEGGA